MNYPPRAQMTSAQLDTSTPAVVLKLDPNVMHHGGLGAIRSLGRLRVEVYGVHEGRWAPAAHSADLSGRFPPGERAGGGPLLQEHTPASAGGDWFFHGYCDALAVCHPAYTGV